MKENDQSRFHHSGQPDEEYFRMEDSIYRANMEERYGIEEPVRVTNALIEGIEKFIKVQSVIREQVNEAVERAEKRIEKEWNNNRNI